MLENVFRFGDKQLREVMTPRTELIWVDRKYEVSETLDMGTLEDGGGPVADSIRPFAIRAISC